MAAYVEDIDAARSAGAVLTDTTGVGDVALHREVDGAMVLLRASGPPGLLAPAFDLLSPLSVHLTATRDLLRHRVCWAPGSATPGVGTIYGVRRHPKITSAEFHDHWEHSHGPVALAHHLGMWDYRQVSVVETLTGPPLDGIAVVQWPTDEDRRYRFFDDENGAAIVSADAAAFTDRTHLHHHLMVEELLHLSPLPRTGTVELTDHRSVEFDVSAARLWQVVGAFDALLDWWPAGIVACDVDDPDDPTQRTLTRTDGSRVIERLVHHRDDERLLMLEVSDGLPSEIQRYTCRYEVRPLGSDRCRLDWQPRARIDAGATPVFEEIVDFGWQRVASGLTAAFGN